MKINSILPFLITFCLMVDLQAATFRPVSLSCEQIANPLGIENRQPLLNWKIESIEGNTYSLSVEIQANTSAAVYVKTTNQESVKADGQATYFGYEDGYAVYKAPSGKYNFTAQQ